MYLLDGKYFVEFSKPSGWFHAVLNYLGPGDNEGIQMFFDGVEMERDMTQSGGPFSAGDGRIVVGRRFTDQDKLQASIAVDELIFFNQSLTVDDIEALYQSE